MHVVNILPSDEYLTIKFVCKKLNQLTKRQDGSPIRKVQDVFLDPMDYGQIMARIEAGFDPRVNLIGLTCSECGLCLGIWNGEHGFDDIHYDRLDPERACMECYPDEKTVFQVGAEHYVWCTRCTQIKLKHDALRLRHFPDVFGPQLLDEFEALSHPTKDNGVTDDMWICRTCTQALAFCSIGEMNLGAFRDTADV